jgi:hypothetical protein
MRAEEELLSEEDIDGFTMSLQVACDNNDCEAIQTILLDVVDGFNAKDGISDAHWNRRLANGINQINPETDGKVITGRFNKS